MSRGSSIGRPNNTVCEKCGKGFERTKTISEHEALKMKCPKYGSKKVSFVPGNVYVMASKKSWPRQKGVQK